MKKWKTLVWAFCFAWRLDKKMLLACFGINAVISVMPAAVLHYNQQVIAGITEFAGRGNGTFGEIAGGIIALGLAMTVYGLSNRINGDLLYMIMYDSYYLGMEEALMEKIQRIPYKVLKQRKTQEEYIAVINRAGSLTDLTSALCVLPGRILTAVSLLLVVIRQSVWSFWIVLIYIVVSAAVSSRYIDRQRVNMLEVRKNENVAAYFQNLPLNPGVAKEIRIYDTYRDILKQWGQAFENIEKQERTYAWGKESQSFRNGVGLYVFMALLCVFQIFQIAGGRMTVDAFLTIFLLCQNLSGTVRDITGSMISLDYGLFSLERQKRFLQEMPEMNASEESQRKFRETSQAPAGECLVQLRDVSFGYEEKIILKNIRLDVKKGEVIALLGRNGSGKSTLAKVIAGQLWPDEGELFFQGCPYQKENMESIRKKIGIYFQDFFLFHMTLKENIQIGSIDCTDSEELERALKVSFHTKSRLSRAICVLGFGMAFFPALISLELEQFSNSVQELAEGSGTVKSSLALLGLLIGLYILQLGYEFLRAYALAKDKLATTRYIKEKIIQCTCRVPYSYVENDSRFREQIAFAESYAGGRVAESMQAVVSVLQYAITFASTVWILCRVHVLIVVILLITCIPAVILAAVQKDETYRASTKWMTEGVWVIHQFFMCCGTESLNEVRHLGIFLFLKERWKKYSQEYLEKKNALTRKHVLYNSAADILRNVVYIGVLLLAAHEIFQNPGMGVGVFMLVLNSSSQFQKVTAQIFTGIVQIYSDIYFMKDFFDLENLYHVPPVQEEKKMNGYDIDFSGITFTYPGKEVPALRDISLRIREGEKIAIVGENGSGKTTFVNLLCGLYAPQQGQVSIGGRNVNGKLDLVRNLVAVVFQDFGKYEESIRRNITVSDRSREKDDGFLYGLLKLVGLEEQVREFPDGLDEVMGVLSENGKNLSGGQWQKLALARALNRSEAKIMILDEPTAAMDAEAETELYRNFTDVTGDRTTLLISHRLGVTKLVDRILVFKDGCVIENGSHQELMEQKGEYARMYQAQAEWYA